MRRGAGAIHVEVFFVGQRADRGAANAHVVGRPARLFAAADAAEVEAVGRVAGHVGEGVEGVRHTDGSRLRVAPVEGQQGHLIAGSAHGVGPREGHGGGIRIGVVHVVGAHTGVTRHADLVDGGGRVQTVDGVVHPGEVEAGGVAAPGRV